MLRHRRLRYALPSSFKTHGSFHYKVEGYPRIYFSMSERWDKVAFKTTRCDSSRRMFCRVGDMIAIQNQFTCGTSKSHPDRLELTSQSKDTDITERHLPAASPLLCYLFIFANMLFGLFMVFCQGDSISATRNSNHPTECKH